MEDGLVPEDEYEENGDNRCQRLSRRHAKEYFEKEYEITGLDLAANYCGDRQPGDTA